tara:strand:- start:630 stop:785 length:156 start_codon:yes stop_codon:yes gene_type:complete
MFKRVVVFPVPGGPKILNILGLFPQIDLLDALFGNTKYPTNCRHRHSLNVD